MTTRMSCSWCHASNVIGHGPVHCGECGHRADVARLNCDCPRCRACRAPTPAEQQDLARDFPQFVRRGG